MMDPSVKTIISVEKIQNCVQPIILILLYLSMSGLVSEIVINGTFLKTTSSGGKTSKI